MSKTCPGRQLHCQDGPSTALLTFMETYHYEALQSLRSVGNLEAPPKWNGVRDILCPSQLGATKRFRSDLFLIGQLSLEYNHDNHE